MKGLKIKKLKEGTVYKCLLSGNMILYRGWKDHPKSVRSQKKSVRLALPQGIVYEKSGATMSSEMGYTRINIFDGMLAEIV